MAGRGTIWTKKSAIVGLVFGWGATAQAMEEPIEGGGPLHSAQPPLSDFVEELIEEQGGASLPVLVPADWTRDRETARERDFRLRLTRRGYTAVFRGVDMDVVITGDNPSASVIMRLLSRFGTETLRDGSEMKDDRSRSATEMNSGTSHFDSETTAEILDYLRDFEGFEEDRGGSVSFGFADCDYQVEFYCNILAGVHSGRNCIAPEEAKSFVLELVQS